MTRGLVIAALACSGGCFHLGYDYGPPTYTVVVRDRSMVEVIDPAGPNVPLLPTNEAHGTVLVRPVKPVGESSSNVGDAKLEAESPVAFHREPAGRIEWTGFGTGGVVFDGTSLGTIDPKVFEDRAEHRFIEGYVELTLGMGSSTSGDYGQAQIVTTRTYVPMSLRTTLDNITELRATSHGTRDRGAFRVWLGVGLAATLLGGLALAADPNSSAANVMTGLLITGITLDVLSIADMVRGETSERTEVIPWPRR